MLLLHAAYYLPEPVLSADMPQGSFAPGHVPFLLVNKDEAAEIHEVTKGQLVTNATVTVRFWRSTRVDAFVHVWSTCDTCLFADAPNCAIVEPVTSCRTIRDCQPWHQSRCLAT